MKKRCLLYVVVLSVLSDRCFALSFIQDGPKFAAIMSVTAILVSLPAFFSIYINIRKTHLGNVLFQPLLAMFVGFFGIMLNSLIEVWKVFNGYNISNESFIMGLNSAISSVLIAWGAVIMFFNVKNKGLFHINYYQRKEQMQNEKTQSSKSPDSNRFDSAAENLDNMKNSKTRPQKARLV
ncbi:MAG: hypothetical protein QXK37_02995 [Candidatus Woesearchaeota archaeon]